MDTGTSDGLGMEHSSLMAAPALSVSGSTM